MVLFERVTPPFGSKMTDNDLQLLFNEYELSESEFKKPTVNRRFWRQLTAVFGWIMKYGMWILLAGLIGYGLLQQYAAPGAS